MIIFSLLFLIVRYGYKMVMLICFYGDGWGKKWNFWKYCLWLKDFLKDDIYLIEFKLNIYFKCIY